MMSEPYEWDRAKAASNLAKHGIPFEAAEHFDWSTALVRADLRPGDPEGRLAALGLIGDRLFHMTYVIRRSIRIISLRRASNTEITRYEAG
jgi:uncharacterized DUF497 family protein